MRDEFPVVVGELTGRNLNDVVIIHNSDGFDLGWSRAGPSGRPHLLHFGLQCDDAAQVRTQRAQLLKERITLVDDLDTAGCIGVKCLDPDGYQAEIYWEA